MRIFFNYYILLKWKLFSAFRIFFFFASLIISSSVWADIQFLPTDYLMEEASESLAQKDYKNTFVFLSQILENNPNFNPAQVLLNQILETSDISAEEKSDIVSFQNANQFNNNMIVKISYYIQKRNEVLKKLEDKGFTKEYLNNELLNFQFELVKFHNQNEEKNKELVKSQTTFGLKQLAQVSLLKQDLLKFEFDNIQSQFNHLVLLNKDQMFHQSATDVVVVTTPINNKFPEDYYSKFENQILLLNQNVAKMQKMIEQKDERINQLTDEIQTLTNQFNKNNNLAEASRISSSVSQEDYNDLQARFALGQKIIRQKDIEIDNLQAKLIGQPDQIQIVKEKPPALFSRASVEQELIEVSGMLEIYKSKLADVYSALKMNSAHMSDMEGQLALVQKRLFEKDQLIQKAEQSMQKLEQKLLELKSELDNLRQSRLMNRPFTQKDKVSLQHQLNNIHEFLEVEWRDFQQNAAPLSDDIREP